MLEPVTLAALAMGGLGWTALAALGGYIGNHTDRVACGLLRGLRDRVAGLRGLPENHDLARAVRTAQMQALERALRDFDASCAFADRPQHFLFITGEFCKHTVGRCLNPKIKLNLEVTELLLASIQGILAPPESDSPATQRAEAIAFFAEQAMLDELTALPGNDPLPPAFIQHFRQGAGADQPRFLDLFGTYMAEQIKNVPKVHNILTAGQLARIEGLTFDTVELLDRMCRHFSAQFGELLGFVRAADRKLDGLAEGQARIEAMATQLVAQLAHKDALLLAHAKQAGVTEGQIIALARQRPGSNAADFDSALRDLEYLVGIAIEVQGSAARTDNQEDLVATVLRRVAERHGANDYAGANQEIDAGLAELDRLEAAQRESVQRQRIGVLEQAAQVAILNADIQGAAARLETLAGVREPGPRPAWTATFRAEWSRYYVEGRDKGINISLELAIALARRMQDSARNADERGNAGDMLGTALAALGAGESDTARLTEAVVVLRAALLERVRDRVPLDWAGTQNNLSTALGALGDRENHGENLEAAVAAAQAALEEYTREKTPSGWAYAQTSLGNALLWQGERERGTEKLTAAITAYRAALALEEITTERTPLQWAMIQSSLANALATLGVREKGTLSLTAAVSAFRAALTQRPRDLVPMLWATTQNNLGAALQTLGNRSDSAEEIKAAVAAYRATLEEWTREKMPAKWAMTQNNLGNALRSLGVRQEGIEGDENLSAAMEAFFAALDVFSRDQFPLQWATTQFNIGITLTEAGQFANEKKILTMAVAAYRAALEEFTETAAPYQHKLVLDCLAQAQSLLAERQRDAK